MKSLALTIRFIKWDPINLTLSFLHFEMIDSVLFALSLPFNVPDKNQHGKRESRETGHEWKGCSGWSEKESCLQCLDSSFNTFISAMENFNLTPLVTVPGSLDLEEAQIWWEEYLRWLVGSAVDRRKGKGKNSQAHQEIKGSSVWIYLYKGGDSWMRSLRLS